MRLRLIARASSFALVLATGLAALVPRVARADEPPAQPAAPPPAEPENKIRFTLDLHGGVSLRVSPGKDDQNLDLIARGGGIAGVYALISPVRWLYVGAGYDRAFLGRERTDDKILGSFKDVNRALDELWFLGRFYPYQNEDVGLWLQLGVGPAWQSVNKSIDTVRVGTRCDARGSAGLGLRGSFGADLPMTSTIFFSADVGVDQFLTSGQLLNGCEEGLGAATFIASRLSLSFGSGRAKPPPPPKAAEAKPSDRDNDAILDPVDACPDQPGLPNEDPKKHGCPPPPDRDRDGIADDADACPDQPGVKSDDPKKNGCPADRDGDKIPDDKDACPDVPGVATTDPATNGCPPDTDGDGIRDDKDACPADKGLPNEDPAKNGCPLVIFTDKEIVIGEQIQFEVDKAIIRKVSDPLVDTIAQVIKSHPEIKKLEVQGHTDNSGKAQHNKQLSQRRAEAVKIALTKRGVAARILTPKGYGPEQPIATNDTPEGKQKNRRVQFKIIEMDKKKDDKKEEKK